MQQDVNYIKHLNTINAKFYDETEITSSHIAIYNSLFQFWNDSFFDTDLSINRGSVMKLAKIGSVNTYLKCLKDLDRLGYLKYKPSHNPLIGSIINLFRFDTSSDKVVIKSNTSSDTSSDKVVIPYINIINNETIKLINNNATLVNGNIEKWINEELNPKTNKFDFKSELIKLGVDKSIASDYLLVRKNKKAPNTKTALDAIIREISKTSDSVNDIIKLCAERGWVGFKASWNYKTEDSNKSAGIDISNYF